MTNTITDIHAQFADLFNEDAVKPWAWYLSKKLSEGHICISLHDGSILRSGHPFNYQPDPAALLACESLVSTDPETKKPFMVHEGKLYLQRYFQYETQLISAVKQMLDQDPAILEHRMTQLNTHLPGLQDTLLNKMPVEDIPETERPDWQFAAAIQAFLHDFSIITGGPGTGKTTTVAKVLALLYTVDPGVKVAMAAPTGKAKARMLESLRGTTLELPQAIRDWFNELESFTLHRLLGSKPESVNFIHTANNPLPYDVVIVDEASMIDMPLFAKLLQAIKPGTRLILLGDRNQLASVEAGSILGDLCKCIQQVNGMAKPVIDLVNKYIKDSRTLIPAATYTIQEEHPVAGHITELLRNFRYAESPGIGALSHAIMQNEQQTLDKIISDNPYKEISVDTSFDEDAFKAFIGGYQQYIRNENIKEALEQLNQLRVLVAVREGEQGLYSVNKKIEAVLKQAGLIRPDTEFYENRPLIITRNNYDLKIDNGDIGIVRTVNGRCSIWFPDPENPDGVRPLNPAQVSGAETVFAMTIHKSQGSEYGKVMIILPDTPEHPLLTRELLYTAVTRAKKSVLIQSRKETLLNTAKAEVKRSSGIAGRF